MVDNLPAAFRQPGASQGARQPQAWARMFPVSGVSRTGGPAAWRIRYASTPNPAPDRCVRRGPLWPGREGKTLDEKKPAAVTERKIGGTTFVVSSFFNEDSKETAADKMARLIEREAGLRQSVTKI